ncbi:non-structural maintenance of chromosomes element 4 homolog A-like protein, partial [Tanacetum coccineum]
LMQESVTEGEELMPYRIPADISPNSQRKLPQAEIESVLPTTPIRKFSRNRGLVLQEQTVAEDSPESGDSGSRGGRIWKRKRIIG